jgi:hypothetical protein
MKTKLIRILFFSLLLHPFVFRSTAFAQVASNAGRITSFSPAQAPRGTTITLNGQNFNRDRSGNVWSGAPPYRIWFFRTSGIAQFTVAPTFVSSTQLRVNLPATGATGSFSVRLTEPIQGGVGSGYGVAPNPFLITAGGPCTVRFVNQSSMGLVSVTNGGAQALPFLSGALPGQQIDVALSTSGTFAFVIGLGNFTFLTRNPSFFFNRTVDTTNSAVTTINVNNPTIGQVLTVGSPSNTTTWLSDLFFDAKGQTHQFRFRCSNTGSWRLFADNNTFSFASGSATMTLWPPMTSLIQTPNSISFSLTGLPNNPTAQTAFPYGSFFVTVSGQVRQFTRQ